MTIYNYDYGRTFKMKNIFYDYIIDEKKLKT